MLCVPYGLGYVPNKPSFRTCLKWFIYANVAFFI